MTQSGCPHVFSSCKHKIPAENLKIWRYMDYWKFESMIKNRSLYFCRSDNFPDKFEGSNAARNILIRKEIAKKIGSQSEEDISKLAKNWTKCMFINCWSIDKYEDWLKWVSYTKCNDGIAIQTTYKRLYNSLKYYKEKVVCFGRVTYIEYEKDLIPNFSDYSCFLHKYIYYRNESELRAILRYCDAVTGKDADQYMMDIPCKGVPVPVDLDILIEKIYTHPNSKIYLHDRILSILHENKLNIEVFPSKLVRLPLF